MGAFMAHEVVVEVERDPPPRMLASVLLTIDGQTLRITQDDAVRLATDILAARNAAKYCSYIRPPAT